MSAEEILNILKSEIADLEAEELQDHNPACITVEVNKLKKVLKVLHTHEKLYFDLLSCITAIDKGEDIEDFELSYNLASIPFDLQLNMKVKVKKLKGQLPQVPSVSDIYKTALWHEREIYDLMGISFEDHPDMRRIFLPEDWKGHPLRKDYEDLKTYHGIKVAY